MASSVKPISRPAPLIDSQSEVVEIPDSQTTEHAPQVVQRKRLPKRTERSGSDEGIRKIFDRIPLGRGVKPEEIGATVVYLASDAATYATGIAIPLDGGMISLMG